MIDKALLTGAFEKMGPERVERMLVAFGPAGEWDCYCRCALGFAAGFGEKTDNQRWDAMTVAGFQPGGPAIDFLANSLGINLAEANAIEKIHTRGTAPWREEKHVAAAREFVALANEWLENRPAFIRPVQHLESVSR